MTFESLFKIFKNTKVINKDSREIIEMKNLDFVLSDGYDAVHNVQEKSNFFKYDISIISSIDTVKRIVYIGTKNKELVEPIDIKVKDLFILSKHLRFKYLYSEQKMVQSIKKMKIEFIMYKNNEWIEEKFYCYPYKEYLESHETMKRFLIVAEASVEEISEILITEDNEILMKVIVISEGN
jgi:hypothetical protein